MKNLLFTLLLLPVLGFAQSSYTTLHLTDITATQQPGTSSTSNPIRITLKDSKKVEEQILINDGNLQIRATFKIASNNSRRSSSKSGSVRVTVNYTAEFAGKKDKRTAEYIYYLGDERKLDIKEMFVFKNGLNPLQVTLTYEGFFEK